MNLSTRPLRAADLKPGDVYYSPTGRLCLLLQPQSNGISRTSYLFAYLTRNLKPSDDDGFSLSASNAQAIAAMRPAVLGGPMTAAPVLRARGLAT